MLQVDISFVDISFIVIKWAKFSVDLGVVGGVGWGFVGSELGLGGDGGEWAALKTY